MWGCVLWIRVPFRKLKGTVKPDSDISMFFPINLAVNEVTVDGVGLKGKLYGVVTHRGRKGS